MGITNSEKATLIHEFQTAATPDEAWVLAQRLTALDHPTLYRVLNDLRRKIVRDVISKQLEEEGHVVYQFSFQPRKPRPRELKTWKTIDITPEISLDQRMQNIGVHGALVKKLRKLIREQIWLLSKYER